METRGSISACNGFGKRIIIKKKQNHIYHAGTNRMVDGLVSLFRWKRVHDCKCYNTRNKEHDNVITLGIVFA